MRFLTVFLIGTALLCSACESSSPSHVQTIPHMDLDASSAELDDAISETGINPSNDPQLGTIVQMGKRNLEWIRVVSDSRPEGPLSLSVQDMTGFPMDKPRVYSGEILQAAFEKWKAGVPDSMLNVLSGQVEMPAIPPVDSQVYLEKARALDTIYQLTLRWIMYKPALHEMTGERAYDIRGYYFLTQRPTLSQDLQGWDSLADATKLQMKEWLLMMCYNFEESDQICNQKFDDAVKEHGLQAFYNYFLSTSKDHYNSFFDIVKTRSEFSWTSENSSEMTVPFQQPDDQAVAKSFKFNVEDEWHWGDWHMRLNYQPQAQVHIQFAPGVVPFVNDIAGDTITMDADSPLTEHDVQYAFRHEFGHVLGFPDCYLEFYDVNKKAIIGYQLDVTDLMCSRAGHFKQRHFDALKKAYFKP